MVTLIENWISKMTKEKISAEHIESMNNRTMEDGSNYRIYYDKISDRARTALVQVDKIKGIYTDQITNGRSVYNLFFSATGEIPKSIENLEYDRIKENLDSLTDLGREAQYEFYENKKKQQTENLPIFVHYLDDDVYFLVTDGVHRTVSAIMFGAPMIMGRVDTYKKNKDKEDNYVVHEETKGKWEKINKKLKYISIHKLGIVDLDPFEARFSHQEGKYEIRLNAFSNQNLNLDFDSPVVIVDNGIIEDAKRIEKEKENVGILIRKLRQIDSYLSPIFKILRWLPFNQSKKLRLVAKLLERQYDKHQRLKM
ncbi:hypothetical protein COF42_20570 [Bacillus wiedmannii]|uniref:hypothetical protein n=1 Tax=Bacillus wiedmannii TaxID=1890302 RepID=UPI000BFC2346|nr:hypothetical protein [Bacillus wiedmannii]PHC84836.1 hypothetical protein COF42_20570 [Bacillus wiedmannii]